MKLFVEIIAIWTLTSCVCGTIICWAALRQRRESEKAFNTWLRNHPGCEPSAMPAEIAADYFGMPISVFQNIEQ